MSDPVPLEMSTDWSPLNHLPWVVTNAFNVTLGGSTEAGDVDGIQVACAFVAPPTLVGEQHEVHAALEQMNFRIAVQPVARLHMSVGRAKELHRLLTNVIEQAEHFNAQVHHGR